MRSIARLLVSMWLACAAAELSAQSRNAPRAIAAGQSLWMEELTWMEVRDLIEAVWTTVIIGTGGVEQNGPYVVSGKHNYVLQTVMPAIARAIPRSLLAPIVQVAPEGRIEPTADGHMRFPGNHQRGAGHVRGAAHRHMGWFGLHGERNFAQERLSGFVGVGYTPSIDPGDPSGPTFAVGLRGLTTGIKHRGFLALSVSQLAIKSGFVEQHRRFYGPGLEAGYQFVSRGGFTFMASLGLGYASGVPDGEKEVGEVLARGLGYTWRR
jgi:hypothetical protein